MKKTIYLSVPVSLDWNTQVQPFIDQLNKEFNVTYWMRGTHYYANRLQDADAVVFLLPGLKFESELDFLPTGLKSEFNICIKMNKNIYLGYNNIRNIKSIYNAEDYVGKIKGVLGSSGNIYSDLLPIGSSVVTSNRLDADQLDHIGKGGSVKCVAYTLDLSDNRILLML
jgi:hypothetical protein